MKWIRIFCLLGWLSAGVQATDEARPAGRRFLLIVEASASTEKLGTGVEDAVRGLAAGSFAGKIGPGDTLGVWAYAVGLDLRFPMQVWKQDSAVALTDVLVRHVQTLKSDQPPIWENVLPSLQKVVAASDDLTVAIISSPGSRLTLEGELNARIGKVYASVEADLRKNRLPFVTFLAVRGGQVVDAAVNSGIGPWTIPDPPVPPRPKPDPTKKAVGANSARPKPSQKAEPLPPVLAHSNASQVLAAVAETQRNEAAAPQPQASTAAPAEPISAPVKRSPVEPAPVPVVPKAVAPNETTPTANVAPPVIAAPAPKVEAPAPSQETPVETIVPAVVPTLSKPSVVTNAAVSEAAPRSTAPIIPSAPKAERSPEPILATATVSRTGYLVGGAGLLTAALGLLAWQTARRRRWAAPTSLITQSYDRR